MSMKSFVNDLGISIWGIVWSRIKGGWKGVAIYLCKALTALLKKLPSESLKKYSDVIRKVMDLVNLIVVDFVPEAYKEAGEKTVAAIKILAEHVEDGEYTEEELDADIDAISACIDAWKNVGDK